MPKAITTYPFCKIIKKAVSKVCKAYSINKNFYISKGEYEFTYCVIPHDDIINFNIEGFEYQIKEAIKRNNDELAGGWIYVDHTSTILQIRDLVRSEIRKYKIDILTKE